MTPIARAVVRGVLHSLNSEPEAWTIDRWTARKGDIEVWISNRYYGTEIKYGGIYVGGMSIFWGLFPTQWWRVRVVRAVERAQAIQLGLKLDRRP